MPARSLTVLCAAIHVCARCLAAFPIEAVAGTKWRGCWAEYKLDTPAKERALPMLLQPYGPMNAAKCVQLAKAKGLRFAALQVRIH